MHCFTARYLAHWIIAWINRRTGVTNTILTTLLGSAFECPHNYSGFTSTNLQQSVGRSARQCQVQSGRSAWEPAAAPDPLLWAEPRSSNSSVGRAWPKVRPGDCSAHAGRWHRARHWAPPGTGMYCLWEYNRSWERERSSSLCDGCSNESKSFIIIQYIWLILWLKDILLKYTNKAIKNYYSLITLKGFYQIITIYGHVWLHALIGPTGGGHLLVVFSEAMYFHSCLAEPGERLPEELLLSCLWTFSRGVFF